MNDYEAMRIEREMVVGDLFAFKKMQRVFLDRKREVEETEVPEKLKSLVHWAGASAIEGMLDVLIYQMEKTLEVYDDTLRGMEPPVTLKLVASNGEADDDE